MANQTATPTNRPTRLFFGPARANAFTTDRYTPSVDRFGVLLSGEHPTLPAAELRALLDVHDPTATVSTTSLGAVVQAASSAGTQAALKRMALASSWGLLWGELVAGPDAPRAVRELVTKSADGKGTAGVHVERRGVKNADHQRLQMAAGDGLRAAGHTIELSAPRRQIFLWLLDDRILVGEKLGGAEGWLYESRAVEKRMHFSPVSLHPRRAAALLHLARVAPPGRVLDPFCGTGGIVLEAAREGYDAWGSDLDGFMVQGTLEALADADDAPLAGTAFEADIADVPDMVEAVAGIVSDLPYGRSSTTAGEGVAGLYERAWAAFAKLLPPGGYAVVGMAEPELLRGAAGHGLAQLEVHTERMHRSLTRHFAVLRRM